jgi:hypothetical protein
MKRSLSFGSCVAIMASYAIFATATPAQAWEEWEVTRHCGATEELRMRSKNTVATANASHDKAQHWPTWINAGFWRPAGTVTRESWGYHGGTQYARLTAYSSSHFSSKAATCIDVGWG